MTGRLVELNGVTFTQALDARIPLAVDFYADWCVPCEAADTIIEKLAEEYHGKIAFARLNIDENHEVTDSYQVMSIPALLIFAEGKVIKRFVGVRKIRGCRREISHVLVSLQEKTGRASSS
jgi:thioredoxin 1